MRDGTSKLLSLRPVDPTPAREIVDRPAIATPERDNFIAGTAVKLDQLQASHRVLAREVAELTARVAALQEIAGQDHRLHAFQQNEHRAREGRLDEIVRICRDLRSRLDRIEGRSGGDYHAYNSFEAVSRKLEELERSRRTVRRWLLRGTLVVVALAGIGAPFPHGQI